MRTSQITPSVDYSIEISPSASNLFFHMNSFNASTPQRPQPARDNRSAAQRRYRKKEEDGFLQLREALKEVAKDDPRTRQDILRKASCELRRLADENCLLQQKALIEAYNSPQSPSCGGVIYEDPVEWQWSYDSTEAKNTRSDITRRHVFDAAMLPNASMPTAQNYEWFTQLYDANMAQDSSRLNHPWASHAGESGYLAPRPHSESGYYAGCANCQHGE
ncbi:hypothetical protein CY34DRAFT_811678 [Suillus luteus UH-Slu-Lm8-n1]|uniref:BHLH domain-containing protein n=1 Tax=Suillus luteus UH-Slu-Lm8-n1 TaxID=930992 RepID=A0A0D0AVX8_9AGAM|nr:hypothetical protein CY34DRAFT_811678 [Suillus luteus UH-Slu-Lm8-n1]